MAAHRAVRRPSLVARALSSLTAGSILAFALGLAAVL